MDAAEFYVQVCYGYLSVLMATLPVALFIASCNVGFNLIITAFSSGRLTFGKGYK